MDGAPRLERGPEASRQPLCDHLHPAPSFGQSVGARTQTFMIPGHRYATILHHAQNQNLISGNILQDCVSRAGSIECVRVSRITNGASPLTDIERARISFLQNNEITSNDREATPHKKFTSY